MTQDRPVLRLYNTLTRTKEPFRPLDPAHLRVYACGPTVYDFAHIGNARPVIVFDLLFRLLRHLAKAGTWDDGRGRTRVTYVRNVTDVDDKINARAAESGVTIRELTDGTLAQFHEDIRALGVLMPGEFDGGDRLIEPRATDHIEEMRAIIDGLVASGHAYVADGHALFDVPSMPDYGRLSRRPLDEMEAGARVDVAPYKRSPLDFVLWKPSKPGEPAWPSPAGIGPAGRPGWHIECSAMSWTHLGERFDIHAGGLDLIFPHHENEIAQSRCCFGTPSMATVWLHNGFLQVEGDKMSKSLGNFVTIRDLLQSTEFGGKAWYGPTIRLAMLLADYRKPIDWTPARLAEADAALSTFVAAQAGSLPDGLEPSEPLMEALLDDLNTPAMIAELHRLTRATRRGPDPDRSARQLRSALTLLGLETANPARHSIETAFATAETGRIEAQIGARNIARAARDWAESDRIRDELRAMGVRLKDNKDGTTSWEAAR